MLTPALTAPESARDTQGRTRARTRPRELQGAFTEWDGGQRDGEEIPGRMDSAATQPELSVNTTFRYLLPALALAQSAQGTAGTAAFYNKW